MLQGVCSATMCSANVRFVAIKEKDQQYSIFFNTAFLIIELLGEKNSECDLILLALAMYLAQIIFRTTLND